MKRALNLSETFVYISNVGARTYLSYTFAVSLTLVIVGFPYPPSLQSLKSPQLLLTAAGHFMIAECLFALRTVPGVDTNRLFTAPSMNPYASQPATSYLILAPSALLRPSFTPCSLVFWL